MEQMSFLGRSAKDDQRQRRGSRIKRVYVLKAYWSLTSRNTIVESSLNKGTRIARARARRLLTSPHLLPLTSILKGQQKSKNLQMKY